MNGIESAFIARVGSEPELKTSSTGRPWAVFSVAVGSGDDTQWVRVAAFGDRAQELVKELRKGDRVYVEGRLTMRSWQKDGETQVGLNVAAWRVEKLGQIGRNKAGRAAAPRRQTAPAALPQTQPQQMPDDAIPF
jgi:single-strand DNA-binding protein